MLRIDKTKHPRLEGIPAENKIRRLSGSIRNFPVGICRHRFHMTVQHHMIRPRGMAEMSGGTVGITGIRRIQSGLFNQDAVRSPVVGRGTVSDQDKGRGA